MNVAIVGNGPSTFSHEYGQEIDHHDLVVRIKRPTTMMRQRPEHLGRRADYVVGSMALGQNVKSGLFPREYWVFSDPRNKDVSDQAVAKLRSTFLPDPIFIHPELCERWQLIYRKLREDYAPKSSQERKGLLSDEQGHRHFSAGTHAILYAFERLFPDKITLYGFDSVLSGEHSWSLTRGPEWKEYPDHNWPAEFKLLSVMIKEHGYYLNGPIDRGVLCKLGM